MRIILILLLLANAALFALTRLDSVGGGEAHRLNEQVQPDKIKLLTPQEVAALGPAKTAALADVCLEWGPLAEAERVRAMGEIAPLNLGTLVSTRRSEGEGFSVTLPGFPTRAAAERRAGELKARGIGEVSIIDTGRGSFSVGLGSYRTEQSANGRADALAQQGVPGARVSARTGGLAQATIVVRDPPQGAVARVRELAPTFAGSELRVGACERAS